MKAATAGPIRALAASVLAALLWGCARPPAQPADTIYTGGSIVTVNDAQPTAEALAVKDGKILAVGERTAIERAHRASATRMVDLAGHALLPGFIDAHSHYIQALSVARQVNVYPPPAGPGSDPAHIIAELVKFRDEHRIPKGELIQAYGYDDSAMPEGASLTRDDLDRALPDHPVLVGHVSMHGAVLNSPAFAKWGISAATKTPPGGVILRKPGSREPAGLIMETAYLPVFASLPKPDPQQEVEWSRAGQVLYAQAGITTAQEGATHADELALLQRVAEADANIIDIVAYPFILDLDRTLESHPVGDWGEYHHRLKLGGVKITIDGSPQGRTAYFSTPYLRGGPNGEKGWRGELTFPEAMVRQMVKRVYELGVPLNIHANGDAAIDVFLKAHELASGSDPEKDRRVTLIHGQFARRDQLEKFRRYRITPSFYTLHTYYFSDAHIANRGAEQAGFISPMRAALAMAMHPTNHTDFVVAPLDQMFMMWSAVNRVTRSGGVLGGDQRISPLDALKTMTLYPAMQYGEQEDKGSLETGKLADLVILDRNPLEGDPMTIKDIRVLETVKEGKTIYKRP